ncbi:MAG: glycosyltransferase, partial [Pseudomonadota bacterium]
PVCADHGMPLARRSPRQIGRQARAYQRGPHGVQSLVGIRRIAQAVAHALVDQHKGLSVLIISGSSIAGAFDFKARVDFIKVPSVIKLRNGITSLSDHIDIAETLAMRRAIIESAAVTFRPDVFIVDKEPRGLKGELDPTLPRLAEQGCSIVLGVREVLDEPRKVAAEWAANDALTWVAAHYDRIWVYGSRDFYDPLQGIDLPPHVAERVEHVGFLARTVPRVENLARRRLPKNYVLVTAGGGGDGAELMEQVLAAREHDRGDRSPYVLVLGPFMGMREKAKIRHRASRLHDVHVLDFDSQMETLMQNARAVVAMGGYNTFCELMSFNCRALIVPRKTPRREQLIRAEQASAFGLLSMIDPDDARDPRMFADALRHVVNRPRPSAARYAIDLGGLDRIGRTVAKIARERRRYRPAAQAS